MSQKSISDEAVEEATGKIWEEWFTLLDEWGGAEKGHKATAAHLKEAHGLSGWWSQSVTVHYERDRGLRELGETSKGYQMGTQKTFLDDREAAWGLISSPEGVGIWLGDGAPDALEEGDVFTLADGTDVEIRVVRQGEYYRLFWQPSDWAEKTTLQVRANESSSGRGTVAFHHESLPDAERRDQMKEHWRSVLAELARG